jgi:hypothetical protein
LDGWKRECFRRVKPASDIGRLALLGTFGVSGKKAAEAFRQFQLALFSDSQYAKIESTDPTHGMTVRERALYLQQHRNTGPRSEWGFERNGKKIR